MIILKGVKMIRREKNIMRTAFEKEAIIQEHLNTKITTRAIAENTVQLSPSLING